MDLSPAGAAFVRVEEGVELKFYLDSVGCGTIGIGFTWGSAAFRKWWTDNKPGMTFGPGATMLTRGERGPSVATLISNLADLGYYRGKLDDVFGYGTEAAVLAFQRDHALTADGNAGEPCGH